jgi:MoxR-like ATPase
MPGKKKKRSAKDVLADLEAVGGLLSGGAPPPITPISIDPIEIPAATPADDLVKALEAALGSSAGIPAKMMGGGPFAPGLGDSPVTPEMLMPLDYSTILASKTLGPADLDRLSDTLESLDFESGTVTMATVNAFDPPPGFSSAVEAMLHPVFIRHALETGVFYLVMPTGITRIVVAPEVPTPAPVIDVKDGVEAAVEDFYLKPDWYDTLVVLVERGSTVLLIGPAGCGKTQAVENVFKERDQRLEIVSCTPRTTANDLEGATDLVYEEGQQVTSFTPASPAIASEKGYGLLLDEADAAPSEAMYSMYRLLDKKPMHIVRKGFEGEIPLHTDFRVIGTQNTEGRGDDRGLYHGRAYQDEAFLDRWNAVIRVDYPTLEQEVLILRKRTAISGADAEMIVKAAQAMRNSLQADEIMFTCTMRRTLAVAMNIASGFDAKTSWELAAINRATTEDRSKLKELLNRVYGSKFTKKRRRSRKRSKPVAK